MRTITSKRLQNPTSAQLAWLAGLIDGEGNYSIYQQKGKKSYATRLRIGLQSRDKYALDKIIDIVGGRIEYRKKQPSWRENCSDQWCWVFGVKKDLLELCYMLRPYLVIKAENNEQMIKHLEGVEQWHSDIL